MLDYGKIKEEAFNFALEQGLDVEKANEYSSEYAKSALERGKFIE